MGSMSLSDALDSSDPNVGKLKVVSMLESLPGVGKVKARRAMEEVGIADNDTSRGSVRSSVPPCSTNSAPEPLPAGESTIVSTSSVSLRRRSTDPDAARPHER